MIAYIWPLALVVFSNVAYHICAKSVPGDISPFASLTVTYLVGAAASALLYFLLNRHGNFLRECARVNWAPVVLGLAIIGLEAGWIYAYSAGWQVSTAQIVQSAVLAGFLILVGVLFFKETLTLNKVIGVIICVAGLVVINWK